MSNRNYLAPTINPRNNTILKGDILIEGTLLVTEDTVLQSNLTVGENTILGQNLTVAGESILNGPLTVTDSITADSAVIGDFEATGLTRLPATALVGISSPNLITFGGTIPSIKAGSGNAYFAAPRAGTIIQIAACPQAAITVGDAILTPGINGVAMTAGAITLPLVGTAPGDPGYSNPTGLNIVALNDIVQVVISGTNDSETTANIVFTLQYT